MQIETTYAAVRDDLQAGDVFAFLDLDRFLSRLIHRIAGGPSHVGLVSIEDGKPTLIHADAKGIIESDLDDYFDSRAGEVWWLRTDRNKGWTPKAAVNYARSLLGTPYDFRAFASAALGRDERTGEQGGFLYAKRDDAKAMCSELVGYCLSMGGYWPEKVNSAEMTPLDLCQCPFEPDYHLLKGDPTIGLQGYGTADPADWIFPAKGRRRKAESQRERRRLDRALSAELEIEVGRVLTELHRESGQWRRVSRRRLQAEIERRLRADPEVAGFDWADLFAKLLPLFMKILPLFLMGEES